MKKKDWSGFTAALADKTGKKGSGATYDLMPWDVGLFKPVYNEKKEAVVSMRFLPMPDGESSPFVQHGLHNVYVEKGRWVKESCPKVAGHGKCPLCEKRNELYNTNKKIADALRAKSYWYANVLIIKNPNDPESEGKVFLLKFGKAIYEKIMAKLSPQDPEIETPVNVFDYEEGANFILKIKHTKIDLDNKQVEMPNYDASEFQAPSKISLGGKVLTSAQVDEIESKLYSLAALHNEKHYKTYEELASHSTRVLGPQYGFGGLDVVPDSSESWSGMATTQAQESNDPFGAATSFASSGEIDTSEDDNEDIFSSFKS